MVLYLLWQKSIIWKLHVPIQKTTKYFQLPTEHIHTVLVSRTTLFWSYATSQTFNSLYLNKFSETAHTLLKGKPLNLRSWVCLFVHPTLPILFSTALNPFNLMLLTARHLSCLTHSWYLHITGSYKRSLLSNTSRNRKTIL